MIQESKFNNIRDLLDTGTTFDFERKDKDSVNSWQVKSRLDFIQMYYL